MEIDQQAHFEIGEVEAAVQLGEVRVRNLSDGLRFDDHFVVHHEIHDLGILDAQAFVDDIQVNLAEDLVPGQPEFMGEASLVGIFQGARP